MPRRKRQYQHDDFQYLLDTELTAKQLYYVNVFYDEAKSRYWASIGYPESMAPMERIKGYLAQHGIRCAISPLHDSDQKADHTLTDGQGNYYDVEYKKAHYHFLFAFGNTTTHSSVLRHCSALGLVHPEPVSSVVSYYRYLKHLDEDPEEKFIYNRPEDVIQHVNGFDLADFASEDKRFLMQSFIAIEEQINKYWNSCQDTFMLENFLKRNGMFHELQIVYQHEKHFKEYCYWCKKHMNKTDARVADQEAKEAIEDALDEIR